MSEDLILYTESEGVARLTINRPGKLNALSQDVLRALSVSLESVEASTDIRVVVLTGAGGKAFVAGADVAAMSKLSIDEIKDYVQLGQSVMVKIENLRVPVIAEVGGFALGGGLELALACDIIACSNRAKVGQPEVNLGILPGFGGTQRLIRRTGIGQARRLVYSGELITASEAKDIGIVDLLFEAEELSDGVSRLANTIASKAPLAVAASKRVFLESLDVGQTRGLELEVAAFLETFSSEDRKEGMEAFLEKREASFKGR